MCLIGVANDKTVPFSPARNSAYVDLPTPLAPVSAINLGCVVIVSF